MKHPINHRTTGKPLFTAEINCDEDASEGRRKRLAVIWALENGLSLRFADLSGAILRGANLSDADLSDADLSGANLSGVDLSGVDLSGVDLSGVDLSGANLSGANLSDADLSGANLSGANLSGANLSGANLRFADLSGANLSGANLSGVDLSGAILRGVDLRGADLPYADETPAIPNIHKVIYEAASQPGALGMKSWHHPCGTRHCWAGWIVEKSGEAARKLEGRLSTGTAAALILMKSDPTLERIPNWHASDDVALAEMKRLADAT